MIKILILEDNRELANTLTKALKASDRKIFCFAKISDFCQFIEKQKVDLCILDRLVEDGDSLDVIEYLNDLLPSCRYIFLTQQTKLLDKIKGLEKGAIDYLVKPFSLAELRIKVRNILGWGTNLPNGEKLVLGEISFDVQNGVLLTPDKEIQLRKREADLVAYLFQAGSRVVSKQQLISNLWYPDSKTKINTIDVYMKRLRKKLGKYQTIIKTRRGFGYQLIAYKKE